MLITLCSEWNSEVFFWMVIIEFHHQSSVTKSHRVEEDELHLWDTTLDNAFYCLYVRKLNPGNKVCTCERKKKQQKPQLSVLLRRSEKEVGNELHTNLTAAALSAPLQSAFIPATYCYFLLVFFHKKDFDSYQPHCCCHLFHQANSNFKITQNYPKFWGQPQLQC